MRVLHTILLAGLVAAPLPAFAYTQEDAQACTPDAFKLCGEFIPDEGRVAQCLHERRPQLSPACAVVFSRPGTARMETRQGATPVRETTGMAPRR